MISYKLSLSESQKDDKFRGLGNPQSQHLLNIAKSKQCLRLQLLIRYKLTNLELLYTIQIFGEQNSLQPREMKESAFPLDKLSRYSGVECGQLQRAV